MHFERSVDIDAPVERVWAVYTDVLRWPEWTTSVRACSYEHGSTLEIGARVRIDQPRLRPAVWEVTSLEPGRAWEWTTTAPGLRTVAGHVLTPTDSGGTRVDTALDMTGLLAPLLGRLSARLTRDYLATEAAGLAERVERPQG